MPFDNAGETSGRRSRKRKSVTSYPMKRTACLLLTIVFLAPAAVRSADDPSPGDRPRPERRWTRNWSDHLTNAARVKSAFHEAISDASAATVTILSGGEAAALGVVLDGDGHVVTKASELAGKLTCRTADGAEHKATLLGSDEPTDLAVLKVDATGLKPAIWRTGGVPLPGSLVASVGAEDEPISVGVVSSGVRSVGGPTQSEARRGRLGVGLGEGDGGLGIASVEKDSAADEAGIQPGDRILRIDGKEMKDYEQVVEAVGANPPGRTIRITLQREEKEMELSATLGRTDPQPQPRLDHWGGGPFSDRRFGFPSVLPHDSVVDPSQCGGPLVDTDGKIVGINIARALRVTTYALPAEVVLGVAKKLLVGGE